MLPSGRLLIVLGPEQVVVAIGRIEADLLFDLFRKNCTQLPRLSRLLDIPGTWNAGGTRYGIAGPGRPGKRRSPPAPRSSPPAHPGRGEPQRFAEQPPSSVICPDQRTSPAMKRHIPALSTRAARRIELAESVASPFREMNSLSWPRGPRP